jgi:hypothetical protein
MGILRTDKISGLEKEKRQNPNLVSNGDFSDSSIAGWTAYNAVVSHDSGVGGRIKVDDSAAAGGWSNAAYVINTEPGASYRFEVRASATDSDTQFVGYYQGTYDTAGTAPTVYSSEITTTPSVHYFDLIATGSTVTIMLIVNNNGVAYFDDVSFRKNDGNPIGGSVHFDGTGDYLSFATSTDFALGTDDWTVEWFAYPTSETQYQRHFYLQGSSSSNIDGVFADSSGIAFGRTGVWAPTAVPHPLNQWNHYALVHDSTNMRLYINGVESLTSTDNFGTDSTKTLNIGYSNSTFGGYFTGYISNFRILKGTALYTEDFTPPAHELEVIGDTVLLCCNNSDSVKAESTGKTITTNGSPVNSTENPGLSRDFTSGTEFRGVTTFDTQGYFVPPSGTTEQRGRGRILIAGGNETPPSNVISYVNASTSGNAVDFGDLVTARRRARGLSSSTRGVFTGGFTTTPTATYFNIIDYVTIASTGNAVDFGGDTSGAASYINCASSTRGIMAGGLVSSSPNITAGINFLTIASTGQDVSTFGDLTEARRNSAGFASPTRGVFAAGFTPVPASTVLNTIDFITIASTGNAVDFGDCATTGFGAGSSNSTRGVFQNRTAAGDEAIEYVTIASLGNSQDFGSQVTALYMASGEGGATSTRALWCGGYTNPGSGAGLDNIFYVNIATTGDVQDFGDLTQGTNSNSTISDSHGGLS